MTPEQRDMLALALVPGLGPRLTAALLEHFGSAAAVRQASSDNLRCVPHIGTKLANDFAAALRNADVEAEVARMERANVWLRTMADADYPPALATISDPPLLIYGRGNLLAIDEKAVALVGSRQCTPYGKRMTEKLAAGLAHAGYTVISGLARGIDAAAHQGALDGGGRTIAVLAGGLSSIYPPEHVELADAVARSGALLSETPMAMKPQRGMFHARNRLISGLSRAVVIIEANDRSGALITARHAGEQGRDVFAVPANADSPTSAGSLKLLRNGARLIRGLDDLLEDLQGIPVAPLSEPLPPEASAPNLFSTPSLPPGLTTVQEQIWELLATPTPIDELTRSLGMAVAELSRELMTMELRKAVRRLPGNVYERRS